MADISASTTGSRYPVALPDRGRIVSLDLARGIAVLGIVAINIEGFAGAFAAVGNPDWTGRARLADYVTFSMTALFFEGKMRALFTLLFGAGIVFFTARRADNVDNPGRVAISGQVRRLLALGLFGYAHYLFLWRGDILLLYAVAGAVAMMFVQLSPLRLVVTGMSAALFYGLYCAIVVAPTLLAVDAVAHGHASAEQAAFVGNYAETMRAEAAADIALFSQGMGAQVGHRLTVDPLYPLTSLTLSLFESIPLMLIGMGLAKGGFFTGRISATVLARIGVAGVMLGMVWAGLSLGWLYATGFSPAATPWLFFYTGLPGRTAMALGYLAIIVRFAPTWCATWPGRRLAAAGRMAFSNYLLTSLVMTFIFHGWGLGLIAEDYGHARLMLFVGAVWLAMLGWSAPWLRRFHSGPLEMAWRRLAKVGQPGRNAIGSQ